MAPHRSRGTVRAGSAARGCPCSRLRLSALTCLSLMFVYLYYVHGVWSPFLALMPPLSRDDEDGDVRAPTTAAAAASTGSLDAIVVPGGGLTPEGHVHPWVAARCAVAARLYHASLLATMDTGTGTGTGRARRRPRRPPVIVTLSGGTSWKPPPLDARGFPITEAAAAARYLAETHNVSLDHIVEEGFSLDTIGNAYFLRAVHAGPAQWRSLAVVTNRFHMPRTRRIFQWVFGLDRGGTEGEGKGQGPGQGQGQGRSSGGGFRDVRRGVRDAVREGDRARPPPRLYFVEALDVGMDGRTVELRRKKEAASLAALGATTARVSSMEKLHRFVFTEHMAYASRRHDSRRAPPVVIDPAVLGTY